MTFMQLIQASARAIPLADESVQCVVTSPPYWGLRQYAGEQREVWGGDAGCAHEWGAERYKTVAVADKRETDHASERDAMMDGSPASQGAFCACGAWYGALGLEPTPELYVAHMVEVFREVRRVMRPDATLWLNLGDSYAASGMDGNPAESAHRKQATNVGSLIKGRKPTGDLKPKDLVGIPWMVAFALRADGWWLRSDIIWHKPNPMHESVTDRPTKSHEYLFLLTKSERYYYDADAIREQAIHEGRVVKASAAGAKNGIIDEQNDRRTAAGFTKHGTVVSGRNKRSVWTIATRPYKGAHFATFPPDLVEPCVLAGSSPKACGVCGAPWERVTERRVENRIARVGLVNGDRNDGGASVNADRTYTTLGWRSTCDHEDDSGACVVLDPFNGSGTTGRVAIRHGRSYVGIDISSEYLKEQATKRIDKIQHAMPL